MSGIALDAPRLPTRAGGLARDEFVLPGAGGAARRVAYLCGHSLGPMPLAAATRVGEELARWARLGVQGHFSGDPSWIEITRPLHGPLARLVGARPDEVVAMNALGVNLQLMLRSFHRPQGGRNRLLLGPRPFPSDRLVAESHCRLQGLDPRECVVETSHADGEGSRTEAVVREIRRQGERLALVCVEAVDFLTGEAVDLAAIARAARAEGALVGFDLAHAIGNVKIDLPAADADFAVWCSYKYLNAGPGALAGAFVHRRHHGDDTPRAAGWWGVALDDRFAWDTARRRSSPGAQAWQVSNPPVLEAAALRAALDVFERHDEALRLAQGLALVRAAREAVLAAVGDRVELLTPGDAGRHGQMLALRVREGARGRAGPTRPALERALQDRGVVVDARGDIVRVAFCPLYNDLADVHAFAAALEASL